MGRGGGGSHSSSRSSGGGRSSSRSFGGSSSHSSRGGGSSISRSSSHSSRTYNSMPSHSSVPRVHVTRHYHYGPSYGYGRTYRPAYGWNLFTQIMIIMIAVITLAVIFGISSSSVTKSTITREPLKPYSSFDTQAIDDNAGWIYDRKTLIKGMETFYTKTGIQPALAVYEEINGEKYLSDEDIYTFMSGEYDRLIGHERGLLVLFCEYADSDWYVYYMTGEDAKTVMDSEACDILIDYVHSLYTDDTLSDEAFFGSVFKKTADRIMNVTPTVASVFPYIIVGTVIIILGIIGLKALKAKHARDAEKAKETERILNSSIDRI